MAAIFLPMSNPASFVLSIESVPVVTRRSTGPCSASLMLAVPPSSDEPLGSTIPIAGSMAASSGIGHFGTIQIHLSTVDPPSSA